MGFRKLAVLFGVALAALGAGPTPSFMKGRSMMAQGRYRLAAIEYQKMLEADPDHQGAKVGLGISMAGLRRCGLALALLDRARGNDAWNGNAAVAQGACHLELGHRSDAKVAFEEAVALWPHKTDAWVGLADLAWHDGDVAEAGRLYQALDELEGGERPQAVLRARWALQSGSEDFSVAVGQLAAMSSPGPDMRDVYLLDGRRWLDLGNPVLGSDALLAAVRSSATDPEIAVWRAEAVRRLGQVEQAQASLGRRASAPGAGSILRGAIESRVLVDVGDLEGARAALAAPMEHAELLASYWYLERAAGNDALSAEYAAHWRASDPNPVRSLDQLLPMTERP